MKTIIAGSRTITDYAVVCRAVKASGFHISEVVSGHAGKTQVDGKWIPTVDRLGERWSREFLGKEPKLFLADWDGEGRAAGCLRNLRMAQYAEALVAVWDGRSRGTRHMIKSARSKGIHVYVEMVPEGEPRC